MASHAASTTGGNRARVSGQAASRTIGPERLVQFLSDPASHGLASGTVERVETHISWVFLTPHHAYKLKKPVRFDFLDFSTAALRRQACEDEVRLNLRLAPQVYLGVEPLVHDRRGRLRIGGPGEPLDWLVKMRRLPADRSLDHLIRTEQLTPFEIQKLGKLLTDFYLGLPPVTVKTDEYRARLQHHVDDNYRELSDPRHGLSARIVKRIHAAQQAYLLLFPRCFDDRVCDGRLVEGHGDLRPEHIYLHGGPKVIDCVEFNLEYRQLDVADELSFLTMECAMLGREALGEALLRQYCDASGDRPSQALRGFYAGYRAMVRAKVAAIRAEQLEGPPRDRQVALARRYLELADRYGQLLGPPLLLIVRGLSGTGKTTLAEALAERFRLQCLQTDLVRRQLFSGDGGVTAAADSRYSAENRRKVYEQMLHLAEEELQDRCGVVLDGTFLTNETRSEALELAARYGAVPLIVECRCPEDVARQRIASRQESGRSASDAFPELVARQRAEEDPMPPGAPLCRVDTRSSLPEMLRHVIEQLQQQAGISAFPAC